MLYKANGADLGMPSTCFCPQWQVARAQARRVRGSHVADMAATLGVDLRPVAREVAKGSTDDSETLQSQLQGACKAAIDVYVSQQGDEGRPAIALIHCQWKIC